VVVPRSATTRPGEGESTPWSYVNKLEMDISAQSTPILPESAPWLESLIILLLRQYEYTYLYRS